MEKVLYSRAGQR